MSLSTYLVKRELSIEVAAQNASSCIFWFSLDSVMPTRYINLMKRILIVDDEQLIRFCLSAAFEGRNSEVVTAQNGRSCLRAVAANRFDYCFLDIQLPDADGIDLMQTIRRDSPGTKIIMMTGSLPDAAATAAIHEHAYLFLPKPFDLARVKKVLDALPDDAENAFQELGLLEKQMEDAAERGRSAA